MGGVYLYSSRLCNQAMRFKVQLLRRRGRRIPWREAVNNPAFVGDLITHTVKHGNEEYKVAALHPIASPKATAPIPDLYEPVLLGFAPLAFRLRGYERIDGPGGAIGVVQEWHCEMPSS